MIPVEFKKLRWSKKEDKPILVKEIDLPENSRGWLVIDSLGNGQARGGIRMGERVNLEEVRELAAEMTLKFSFLNLPLGGAKAGIFCPSPLYGWKRQDLFFRFGEGLGSLLQDQTYLPGTDMGTYDGDIDQLLRGAGIAINNQRNRLDSGYFTAISVFSALQATASSLNIPLPGARIGIQGLGKVGLRILLLASHNGLKVPVVSTRMGALYSANGLDPKQIIDLAEKYGDDLISHYRGARSIQLEELFEQDLDILCPCAGLYPIHPGNMDKINAKVVVSGCNVVAMPEVEYRLYERGITCLPGFVCNSGGVLCYILSQHGLQGEERKAFLSHGIRRKVTELINRARKIGKSPADTARSIVEQNQKRFNLESKARLNGIMSMAIARFRNAETTEMIYTALWPLVQSALTGSSSLRRLLAKKILFERLFRS